MSRGARRARTADADGAPRKPIVGGSRRLLLGVLGASAAAILVGTIVGPPESVVQAQPGADQLVTRTAVVCPYVGGQPGSTDTISMSVLPEVADVAVAEGQSPATATALLGETQEPPLTQAEARGPLVSAPVSTDNPRGYVVAGSDALAPGLTAEQSTLAEADDRHGLADATCTPVDREAWFVGARGVVGHRARLVLSNPTDSPAVVDVEVWDEKGRVRTPAAEDRAVPAHGQETLTLDALAPGSAQLAVHVRANQGRVAAALHAYETEGIDPRGVTWIPQSMLGTRLIVPGVPGTGQRLLQVAAPGDSDAIVSLRVLGPDGAFSPADQSVLTVPGGTVLEVPVDTAVGDTASALELTSDVEITAAVRVIAPAAEAEDAPDIAYTAAVAPLDAVGATLGARVTGGFATTLLMTSTGETATEGTVEFYDAEGTVIGTQDVAVPAESTQVVQVAAPPSGDRMTIVVRPRDPGQLAVVRETSGSNDSGAFLDLVPLREIAVNVRVPNVSSDLLTGLS